MFASSDGKGLRACLHERVKDLANINEVACQVVGRMRNIADTPERLVLLVGPARTGKTRVLKEVERLTGAPRVNLSLELNRRLLNVGKSDRNERIPKAFLDMLQAFLREDGTPIDTVLLDDIQILFEEGSPTDPLDLIRQASAERTLVVGWPGKVKDEKLCYEGQGSGGPREYLRGNLALVTLEKAEEI